MIFFLLSFFVARMEKTGNLIENSFRKFSIIIILNKSFLTPFVVLRIGKLSSSIKMYTAPPSPPTQMAYRLKNRAVVDWHALRRSSTCINEIKYFTALSWVHVFQLGRMEILCSTKQGNWNPISNWFGNAVKTLKFSNTMCGQLFVLDIDSAKSRV